MTTIQIPVSDLPPPFVDLPRPTQLALIHLATEFYTGLHTELRSNWEAALSADDTKKAEILREEGRKAGAAEMLTQLRDRLGAADAATVRIATLEEANKQLQEAAEAEATRRLTERIDGLRKDFELQKMTELADLREKLATLSARDVMMEHLTMNVSLLTEKLEVREAQLAELTAATTKSSHAIGKAGEREVYDMLVNGVCQVFQYSTVVNMSSEVHSADFHLTIRGEDGSPIKILIDSKKYKHAVGSKEIRKLHSDIDADDDANAGIMISLDSPIQTTRMFMIKYTDKKRPVLYLTMKDIECTRRQDILCWAVYALQSIAVKRDIDDRLRMIEDIDVFLGGLDKSISEIDSIIRQQNTVISAMRDMKSSLISKIEKFKEKHMDVAPLDAIEHIDEEALCNVILKSTGKACGKKVVNNSGKCRKHAPRKEKEVAGGAGGGVGGKVGLT
jgi:hypothetical protein